ncbi:hypothetical protein FRC17_006180 [Serendipita sp. 399]|nr:hypothetical protein FRC17_006180 [Serendipita sp. 399]
MKIFSCFAAALTLLPLATAHYRFNSLILNGKTTPEWQYVRPSNNTNYPIEDVTSINIRCNAGAASGIGVQTAAVSAGDLIGTALDIPIFHKGTLNIYMSKVENATTADGSSGWFKIHQVPPVFDSDNSISWPSLGATRFYFTIPPSIPAGQYLLRIEHIALHLALTPKAAQFFLSCAQLAVSGGGSATPDLVQFPGAYKAEDAGILIS